VTRNCLVLSSLSRRRWGSFTSIRYKNTDPNKSNDSPNTPASANGSFIAKVSLNELSPLLLFRRVGATVVVAVPSPKIFITLEVRVGTGAAAGSEKTSNSEEIGAGGKIVLKEVVDSKKDDAKVGSGEGDINEEEEDDDDDDEGGNGDGDDSVSVSAVEEDSAIVYEKGEREDKYFFFIFVPGGV
jgi:hypothetical protein